MRQYPKGAAKKASLRKTPYALALVAALGIPAVSQAVQFKEPSGTEFRVNTKGKTDGVGTKNAVVATYGTGDFVVV